MITGDREVNLLGNVHGGEIMKLVDRTAGAVAQRHSGGPAVTAAHGRDGVPAPGARRRHRAHASRRSTGPAGRRWRSGSGSRPSRGTRPPATLRHVASAYFVFVAIDEDGHPREIPAPGAETPTRSAGCARPRSAAPTGWPRSRRSTGGRITGTVIWRTSRTRGARHGPDPARRDGCASVTGDTEPPRCTTRLPQQRGSSMPPASSPGSHGQPTEHTTDPLRPRPAYAGPRGQGPLPARRHADGDDALPARLRAAGRRAPGRRPGRDAHLAGALRRRRADRRCSALVWHGFVFWVASNTARSSACCVWSLMLLAVGWAVLFIDAWRLGQPLTLVKNQRLRRGRRQRRALLHRRRRAALRLAPRRRPARLHHGDVRRRRRSATPSHGRYNVLLLGGDSGAGRWGLRPDSMTVASIDAGDRQDGPVRAAAQHDELPVRPRAR